MTMLCHLPPRRPRNLCLLFGCLGAMMAGAVAQETPPATAPAAEEAAVRLAWHWQPGKRYLFQTETETILSLQALDRDGDQVLQVIQNTDVTVLPGSKPGTKELRVRFVTLKARMAVEDKVFLYDSEEPSESDPALRQMLADSFGRGFSLIYADDDRYAGLGQVEQPAAAPGSEPSLLAVADARQVAELYRRSLEMALPRPEVVSGDKWVSIEQMSFPQAGEVDVKMNCHFTDVVERDGRPHARVTFQGRLGQKLAPAAGADSRTVKLGGESTLSGHLFFDLERRAVTLSMFLGSIVIDYEGKHVPVRQSVTTRLETIEDAPAP